MVGRLLDFGGQVMILIVQCFDCLWEKDCFFDRCCFWCKVLLFYLGLEGGEVWRDWYVCDDVGIGLFKGVDLCGEIIGQVLIVVWICQIIVLCG